MEDARIAFFSPAMVGRISFFVYEIFFATWTQNTAHLGEFLRMNRVTMAPKLGRMGTTYNILKYCLSHLPTQ